MVRSACRGEAEMAEKPRRLRLLPVANGEDRQA